ncbi:phosphodiesterase/nucleotide pyrophosphatase [Dinoroseobacter shibae DFL 12 = DSM 16493]|jgi:predicted AlkP superfamily phosphohydrolase/phosphomutase|uniref:Phosphodiesterase/nucleotide pyrophosphatase n=1 Tax=Dinoroseobacter shibae (strain DSM 16493 / NCIMB 14021 / DFL 12) TaxID=398580 RepID=A8LP18_DINSH|nr:alkaline phosphatase family protein [Dinoroseobacter shibae]ABV93700.1 phosphodiesterase/nucleotide pyrophosphatase [Dinoroseobacter shibae DFL 12 = DSM 16493]URF45154.1 alkaline phosphatase family protein [Dinoroseobacter shibae]URF49459.1 alkaline phosphatase family protein [Dinoroseobacter shibae]
MSQTKIQTVIIGLDGATYDMLDHLVAEGVMPNLGRIMAEGARGILASTIHPLTPPAWATLMTGRSPGNHGVFDFIRVDREGSKPSYTLATSADVKVPTIWQIASAAGKRATTLNYPVMFPAKPIDGVVIPGYVPWSYLGRAIHPRETFKMLKAKGVFKASEMSTDWQHERKAVQGLSENQLTDWVQFHITREQRWQDILLTLMEEEPSELTAVLFDGVDRIQHLCWHLIDPVSRDDYTTPESVAARELVLQYFRNVDDYLVQIIDKAGPQAQVFIVSDHGFTRSGTRIFYANTFLEHAGLLTWNAGVAMDDQGRVALDENTEASTLIDWAETKAYSLSSSSNAIFIRRAAKPGDPGVTDAAYEAFRDDLIAQLLAFTDPETGKPVIKSVFKREDAFPGTQTERAPDLTLQLHDYSFLSVLRADQPIKDRRVPYATHHPDGIFVATGPGIAAGTALDRLQIADVAPTALYSCGVEVPSEMEGKVAEQAFAEAYKADNPIRYTAGEGAAAGDTDDAALTGDAEEQIRERLKSLGYL